MLNAEIHFPDHHGEDLPEAEADETDDAIWRADNVELTTVGIDIGSSTSHLVFSRVHLQRLGQYLSSRFVVVERETLWRSPILLTPYLPDNRIHAEALGAFIAAAYRNAGLSPQGVDSGAVILTGEALKRENARAIADLFAAQAGKFVCASAGHNLEAILAAYGSGAARYSLLNQLRVLQVDIGGGTSKLALIENGEVLQTAAIEVGGRLVAFDSDGAVVRVESGARAAAQRLGLQLQLGQPLSHSDRKALVRALADCLLRLLRGEPLSELGEGLLLTARLRTDGTPDALTFSGGVAEYFYGSERQQFGDLSPMLADELLAAQQNGELPAPVVETAERIRATVLGASQFTVQLSGNTVAISNEHILPIHNLQVLFPRLDLGRDPSPEEVAAAIRLSLQRFDLAEGQAPIAIAFAWRGDPFYQRLRALADGIALALPLTLARRLPLALVFDGDVGRSIGDILRLELGVQNDLISIDGMELNEFDYIDVGEIIRPADVVPVVIKSLIFPDISERVRGELLGVGG